MIPFFFCSRDWLWWLSLIMSVTELSHAWRTSRGTDLGLWGGDVSWGDQQVGVSEPSKTDLPFVLVIPANSWREQTEEKFSFLQEGGLVFLLPWVLKLPALCPWALDITPATPSWPPPSQVLRLLTMNYTNGFETVILESSISAFQGFQPADNPSWNISDTNYSCVSILSNMTYVQKSEDLVSLGIFK